MGHSHGQRSLRTLDSRLETSLQAIQRAFRPAAALSQHVGVDHRRGHVVVPQQLLNRPDIRPPLKGVRGKTMSKSVARNAFGNPHPRHCGLDGSVDGDLVQMMRLITPERGSWDKSRAGNTYCHLHSRAAPRYFRSRAPGKYTEPCPARKSCSCLSRTCSKCSRSAGMTPSAKTVYRSFDPFPSRTVNCFISKSRSWTRSRG